MGNSKSKDKLPTIGTGVAVVKSQSNITSDNNESTKNESVSTISSVTAAPPPTSNSSSSTSTSTSTSTTISAALPPKNSVNNNNHENNENNENNSKSNTNISKSTGVIAGPPNSSNSSYSSYSSNSSNSTSNNSNGMLSDNDFLFLSTGKSEPKKSENSGSRRIKPERISEEEWTKYLESIHAISPPNSPPNYKSISSPSGIIKESIVITPSSNGTSSKSIVIAEKESFRITTPPTSPDLGQGKKRRPASTANKPSASRQKKMADGRAKWSNWVSLNWSNENFSFLPPRILRGTKLRSLNLNNNPLGEFPIILAQLTNLTKLSLHSISCSKLDNEVGRMIHLKDLNLKSNSLTSLPPTFTSLTSLERLNLVRNQFSTFPEPLLHSDRLTALYLGENQLTSLPEFIDGKHSLTKLETFSIFDNSLSHLPETLFSLTTLTNMDIAINSISHLSPSIGKLINMSKLAIDENSIYGMPLSILRLTNLFSLRTIYNPSSLKRSKSSKPTPLFEEAVKISFIFDPTTKTSTEDDDHLRIKVSTPRSPTRPAPPLDFAASAKAAGLTSLVNLRLRVRNSETEIARSNPIQLSLQTVTIPKPKVRPLQELVANLLLSNYESRIRQFEDSHWSKSSKKLAKESLTSWQTFPPKPKQSVSSLELFQKSSSRLIVPHSTYASTGLLPMSCIEYLTSNSTPIKHFASHPPPHIPSSWIIPGDGGIKTIISESILTSKQTKKRSSWRQKLLGDSSNRSTNSKDSNRSNNNNNNNNNSNSNSGLPSIVFPDSWKIPN